jgi:predicted permease
MLNLRFALRTLFKTPFVTTVAVVSLALGIGANVAIFSLFDQTLLRPLPVDRPGELVNFSAPGPKPGNQNCGSAGDCVDVFSYPMFRDLERAQTVFTGIAGHVFFGANLSTGGDTQSGEGALVSGSYFPVLKLAPALGRVLSPVDDSPVPGEPHVVVLAYDYWRTRFGGDPSVVNRTMRINGATMTIVGVAPEGFNGTTLGAVPKVYVPISMRGVMVPGFNNFDNRRSYWVYLFARLKPGVSLAQAKASLDTQYHGLITSVEAPLQKGMSDATMAKFQAKQIDMTPGALGQSQMRKQHADALTLLFSVTGVVLLIACANIANLLLARSAARANEMAVRLSIGASRPRLIAQLLTESCLLAVIGGGAGVIVARWTLRGIAMILPTDLTRAFVFSIDPSMLGFAALLSLATGLLFGLFPAWHSTKPDLAATLKDNARQPSGSRGAARFRRSLVIAQIALSMALLGAAGLFTKSLANISRLDLGIKTETLLTFAVSPELNGYTPARTVDLLGRLEDRLATTPGVSGVATSLVPLLSGDSFGNGVSVQGFAEGPDTDNGSRFNEVGPGFFKTMGIPILSGREFTRADRLDAPKVAIVTQAFAKKFNLGTDAVGKLMARATGNAVKLDTEIVGLAQDAKYDDVKGEIPPLFYTPYAQDDGIGSVSLFVRTANDPAATLATIPGVMKEIDPNLPVEELKTMTAQVGENVFLDRMITTLSSAFATLATLLAAVGLYGVLAFTVAQRTREFGVRMALGAEPSHVRGLVLRQVGWMTLVGATVGLGLALAIGAWAQSQLFEIKADDPMVLFAAVMMLVVVAFLAGLLPAVRASRIDPMHALRYS